jgi:hypothetical protein
MIPWIQSGFQSNHTSAFTKVVLSWVISSLLLMGCTSARALAPTGSPSIPSSSGPTETQPIQRVIPTASATPTIVPSPELNASQTPTSVVEKSQTLSPSSTPTSTPIPTLGPDEWKELPIIPKPSDRIIEIYRHGLEMGNNPYAFSKVGDCGSTPAWFLGDFDRGTGFYNLGNYQDLAAVILSFKGSFERTSQAARSGFNASSLLTTLWTNLDYCSVNETPLECEYRLHQPVIAFIMLGTNDIWHPDEFEPDMRQIIEYSIDQGVIPILSTKADNMEGDGSINATIAKLALEYDVPLWNFWLAVQPLPDHGLQEDGAHLTWGRNLFDVPQDMTKAWPVRNLTALQVLDVVWKKITGQTP